MAFEPGRETEPLGLHRGTSVEDAVALLGDERIAARLVAISQRAEDVSMSLPDRDKIIGLAEDKTRSDGCRQHRDNGCVGA